MGTLPFPRLSPWVVRLLAIAAGVQLLLATVFVAPGFVDALAFDPATGFARPWTFVTYLFVHGGLFHLLVNSLVLVSFGPPVERRMGSGRFLAFFLYCGIGAAVFAAGLDLLYPVSPFIGMSGAIMGVALAYAMLFPDAEVFIFPLPFPIRAVTAVVLFAAFDLVGAIGHIGAIAHEAHLGGLAFAWIFFRINAVQHARAVPPPPRTSARGALVAPANLSESSRSTAGARAPLPTRDEHRATDDAASRDRRELDRVLDKISANGIGSLSPTERQFLDEIAKRKRG